MRPRVYLDWNATAPPLAGVLDAMREAARVAWANPASIHTHGREARAIVEKAREAVATLVRADPRDVIFTSGGTEANNLALRSAFAHAKGTLVTSRLEHPSITRVAESLEAEGRAEVRWLVVTPEGRVDLGDLERVLSETPVRLVAMQSVNHETGVLQPAYEALALARRFGVPMHVDAVQAWGRVTEAAPSSCDTQSIAFHKIRGPKGVGALVIRPGAKIEPVLRGGAQERGFRPGTVDPIALAGVTVAAQHALSGAARYASMAALRDELEQRVLALVEGARVVGAQARAPHVSSVAFPGWAGDELVAALDLEGVSVSSGSACSAGTTEPSPVVTAMLGESWARCAVRMSLGEETTRDDIECTVQAFARVLAR